MISTIQDLVIQLSNELKERQLKIAVAESCTGGGLAYWMTNLDGSSAWFDCGLVTYSNESKQALLGVNSLTLSVFGSVSEQTVREMAQGVLQHSNAHISVAITGIAGPTGGTTDKPVGTVWIAICNLDKKIKASVDIFSGHRRNIREQAIASALRHAIAFIQENPSFTKEATYKA
jgi:nicotinamide-nucleotide amidase